MKGKIGKYLELTKPKVTLLNLLVGVTCFFLAVFPSVNWIALLVFCVVGYLVCGGCGVLNCVYDQSVDKKMERTSKRAIPSGAVTPLKAMFFGTVITASGITISYVFFNALTAVMIILGAIFYLVVYTVLLKRKSSLNVLIGGTAGCFAALSGWAAASNTISLLPLLISTIDFLWTPGHLWGLAMKKTKEYRAAGIPMLPTVKSIRKTAQVIFIFNLAAIVSSLVAPLLGLSGFLYCGVAVFGGTWFMLENRKLLLFPSENQGFRIFLISMPYLALLMIGLMMDKLLRIYPL